MSGWAYAFRLSKRELAEAEPPGTVKLVEHELHRTRSGRGQESDVIQLLPYPTQSAFDPLNWPAWRKYAILLTMSLYSFVVNFSSAGLAPAIVILQFQILPPRSISVLSHLVAYNVLLIGLSNIFWVPLSNTFGRRPILILAMLLAVFSSVWCGVATSFESLLAARAIQGMSFGPADAISPDVVGEVFFVHERGRAIAIYTLFLTAGNFVGGISGAYIAARLGYQYIFWISTALLAFALLCQLFLVPETSFDRTAQLLREQHPSVTGGNYDEGEKSNVQTIEHAIPERGNMSFAASLKVGIYRGNLLNHFLDPWRSLAFPGTWVVMLHYGGLLGGIVTMSTVGPQLLAMPPYLWGEKVGLIGLGGLIGGLVGGVYTYITADWFTNRQAKKARDGLFEPESRLPAMFLGLFIATTGIWTFGFCAAHPSPHAWAGLVVGFGMVGFGIATIPSIGFNYLIDAYNAISADCFVMTTISRSVVSFAWTFFAAEWVSTAGPALPFGIFGMLMGVFALLTIPLWLLGKRMRIATAAYLPNHANH